VNEIPPLTERGATPHLFFSIAIFRAFKHFKMSVDPTGNATMDSHGFFDAESRACDLPWASANSEDFSDDIMWMMMTDDEITSSRTDLGDQSIRLIPQRSRTPYGSGIDARRTASFRSFDFKRSQVHQLLQQIHPELTKKILREIIKSILENCPENVRPKESTRSHKRSKRGLGLWLQENASLVVSYVLMQSSTR
jgi:hypothetical protein